MLIIKLLSMFDFLYKYNIYNIYVYRQVDRQIDRQIQIYVMLHIMCNIYYTYIIISYKNYIYIYNRYQDPFQTFIGCDHTQSGNLSFKKKISLEMVKNGMCWECNPRKCPFSNKCAPKNMPIPQILISRIGPVYIIYMYIYTHTRSCYINIYI